MPSVYSNSPYDLKLEVIVATINQRDNLLHERMNVQTDTLVCNQGDAESFKSLEWQGFRIRYVTTTERGAGMNRNQGLLRAKGDILLFADDDVYYYDGYDRIILNAFGRQPDADVMFFALDRDSCFTQRKESREPKRVRWHNAFKYGTVRIAIRRSSQIRKGIWFPMEFGPGSKYPSGEDTLFIAACLRSGLVLYTVPVSIGSFKQRQSTWFSGFTTDYYRKKGALFAALSGKWYLAYGAYYLLRHRDHWRGKAFMSTLQSIKEGAQAYLKGQAAYGR